VKNMSIEELQKNIGGIKFTIFSPSVVRSYSVVEITAPETYDRDGLPVPGGLMDPRLGTLEPGQKCATCGNTSAKCPGHFGHIELAEPIIHVAFVDDIYAILQTTCRVCHKIILNEETINEYKKLLTDRTYITPEVLEKVSREIRVKAKKIRQCPHCGSPKYEIQLVKPTTFYEVREEGPSRLLASSIRAWLEEINDENLILLGYELGKVRPEWFVLQVLPVPPVTVRPSITLETGIRSEDDLTHKLVDILRTNQRVKESKESGSPPLIVQDLVDLVQYHVTTYFDNEVSGIPQAHHRSGRPLRTLSQRLKGKEGRFRGNLSGKRVDFSSRTVISPDPNLDINEVGIPLEVAKKLTIPEKVTEWNIERLRQLVVNGDKYPGANYIIRPDGVKIRLDYVQDRTAVASALAPGYVVERHLVDGDIVLFNRQPSLHRMSIMAHTAKILPGRTFRLHPAVCTPYNADFDGDEMNLHVPQGEEARCEAELLMRVQDQILSPRYGGPIIGAIRDFITGAYLLTKDDSYLTKEEFVNLATIGGYAGELPEPAVKEPEPLYLGRQLFSLFLPKGFNYVLKSSWYGRPVVIRDGVLVSGVIDKASIGAERPDSVLHRIVKEYGSEVAKNFLNSILRVIKAYITLKGFTIGYDDFWLPPSVMRSIRQGVADAYKRIEDLQKQYSEGKLTLMRGLSPEEALELYIVNELSKARDAAGKTADKNLPDDNSSIVMARTGARGSPLNIGHMAAALGQQSIRGKRIIRGYENRTLCHFKPNDPNPDSRGFIKSNYREGLNPLEFFFHAMGGREGLVDTAVRTQQSGYMQRRLVNAMEHLRVEYDRTVRDPEGAIIQFLYSEDGVDPSKSDHGKAVNVNRLIEAEQLSATGQPISEKELDSLLSKYSAKLNPKIVDELKVALSKSKLPKVNAERVLERTSELFEQALIEPGEAVGIVAAQSIGEPSTQMTLRTFHFAGVKERDITLGLPRLIELVDARRQPSTPTMDIYLLPEVAGDLNVAKKIATEIRFSKINDVVKGSEIDPSGQITIVLDVNAMEELVVTAADVAAAIETSKRKPEVVGEDTIIIMMEGADLLSLQRMKTKILSSRLKGIPGITEATVVRQGNEWVIQTKGSNLAKVIKIEGVDPKRTITNDIYEIWSTLGIEAARAALVKEIRSTMEEQGLEVDIRHICLVADLMSVTGSLKQVGRHGVVGGKASVLARAAFEITIPTLAEASVKGETEQLRGVTESVIVGLPIPVGTGMVDLFITQGEKVNGKEGA